MEPVKPPAFERVVILGHGLIGGSVALAAAERLPSTDVLALDRGDDINAAADADLVVLATPISEILALLPALGRIVPTTTLVTDTGSTKTAIVRAAAGMRFIGGHPIAGAEVSGLAAARPDLFTDRNWILTPADGSEPSDVVALEHFVRTLGAHPRLLAADEHDRLFAFLSHLPQLVASALMDVVGSRVGHDGLALAGEGLRDTTRLATSPPDIWRDIVQSNEPHLTAALDDLIVVLTSLRDDRSADALTRTFHGAAGWKSTLDAGRYNR